MGQTYCSMGEVTVPFGLCGSRTKRWIRSSFESAHIFMVFVPQWVGATLKRSPAYVHTVLPNFGDCHGVSLHTEVNPIGRMPPYYRQERT